MSEDSYTPITPLEARLRSARAMADLPGTSAIQAKVRAEREALDRLLEDKIRRIAAENDIPEEEIPNRIVITIAPDLTREVRVVEHGHTLELARMRRRQARTELFGAEGESFDAGYVAGYLNGRHDADFAEVFDDGPHMMIASPDFVRAIGGDPDAHPTLGEIEDYEHRCAECGCLTDCVYCEECSKTATCPHGNPVEECDACDIAGDLAFDAGRER